MLVGAYKYSVSKRKNKQKAQGLGGNSMQKSTRKNKRLNWKPKYSPTSSAFWDGMDVHQARIVLFWSKEEFDRLANSVGLKLGDHAVLQGEILDLLFTKFAERYRMIKRGGGKVNPQSQGKKRSYWWPVKK